jgi:uncharacterized membrane protein YcfT
MELMMWIVLGTVAALGVLALIPVLIIGGWYVIVFVIFRAVDAAVDAAIRFVEQGWRTIRAVMHRPEVTSCLALQEVSVGTSLPIPVLTVPR